MNRLPWRTIVMICNFSIAILGAILSQAAVVDGGESPKNLTYPLDMGHSNIAFRIKHFDVGYVYGLFRLGSGKFHLNPDDLNGSFVEASIKAESVNTNHAKRDTHLKSADFFNVKKFDEITFKSSKVEYLGEDRYSVDGKLTFLGVSLPLTVEVTDMGTTWLDHASAYQRGMTATFTIDRTLFGMESANHLGDEVEVFVSLEGGAKATKPSPSASTATHATDDPPSGDKTGDLSEVLGDEAVVTACESLPEDKVSSLAVIAMEKRNRGGIRIRKAMRTWFKKNDITIDKTLRSCLSAISKAAVATVEPNEVVPVDLSATIARGAKEFAARGCAKCHLANGQGGVRGPSLIDNVWEHCDGSIKGVSAVLLSGVPQNKLKDPTRPFAMNPVSGLVRGSKELEDLATYVHSLSQK